MCESFLHDVNLLIGDIRWVGLDRGAYCAPCRASFSVVGGQLVHFEWGRRATSQRTADVEPAIHNNTCSLVFQ